MAHRILVCAIEDEAVLGVDIHRNPGEEIGGPGRRRIDRKRGRIDREPADLIVPRVLG